MARTRAVPRPDLTARQLGRYGGGVDSVPTRPATRVLAEFASHCVRFSAKTRSDPD